mmetsp:Transcript_83379/g.193774  ORF Transcript_83379/g.193774 Transcript_83379/m.193774 type:complete len:273 (+) Transcript_83379:65-883(+)
MNVADVSRGDWQCPNPNCYNHTHFPQAYVYGSSANCKKCGTAKAVTQLPSASAPPGPSLMSFPSAPAKAPMREGDWHCANPNCKNHRNNFVYASKAACPLCGMAKQTSDNNGYESAYANLYQTLYGNAYAGAYVSAYNGTQNPGGEPMPGMTACGAACVPQWPGNGLQAVPGTFAGGRPGDWHCPNPSCKNHIANIVYGSKSRCPLCNTAKPQTGAQVVGLPQIVENVTIVGSNVCASPQMCAQVFGSPHVLGSPQEGANDRARSRSPRSST